MDKIQPREVSKRSERAESGKRKAESGQPGKVHFEHAKHRGTISFSDTLGRRPKALPSAHCLPCVLAAPKKKREREEKNQKKKKQQDDAIFAK